MSLHESQREEILRGRFSGRDVVLSGVGIARIVVLLRVLGSVREIGVPRSEVSTVLLD